jgi:GNAT superfamily N-acetyltransferase
MPNEVDEALLAGILGEVAAAVAGLDGDFPTLPATRIRVKIACGQAMNDGVPQVPAIAQRWNLTETRPDTAEAAALLRRYYEEIVGRYHGRPARDSEVSAAMADEPSDDLPVFLIAHYDGEPVGCAGLRMLGSRVAELTRLFVAGHARGLGGGALLLHGIEEAARRRGARVVRLDTRSDLVEARRLYTKHGYAEIEPYNDGRYAEHWFEKVLVPPHRS